jgi:hypothetical protein
MTLRGIGKSFVTKWWSAVVLGAVVFSAAALSVKLHCQSASAALLSEPGPTFSVPDDQLSKHVTVIAYGDMRFHDASDANPKIANPMARKALVAKIAAEHPDALQTNGDVPYKGANDADYDVFRSETAVWRDEHLRVYPAMGNHELNGGVQVGLDNWWKAFPELKGRRWYSVALGSRIYILQIDSNLPLTEGSEQMKWIQAQIAQLPKSVDFVMIGLHHPPVADIQTRIEVDHNPRPNEIALRDYLTKIAPTTHAQIIVTAGHIHNYERAEVGGVTYLVSGGGGAHPYEVERTPSDLYQGKDLINFHYVKFELEKNSLRATMYRLADPDVKTIEWQEKDKFEIKKK